MAGTKECSPAWNATELKISTEEADQIQRSVKKHKKDVSSDRIVIEDSNMYDKHGENDFSFAQVLQGCKNSKKVFYTGEDEEDITDNLDASEVIQMNMKLRIDTLWWSSRGKSIDPSGNHGEEH